MAEIVQPDGTGEYQCRAYFWWDCRDEKGNKVKAGTYTAVVTAEDASGSKTLEKEVKLAEGGSSETETESESETERETETQQPSTEAPNPNTGKETEKKDPAGNHTESTEKKEVQSISLVSRSAFSGQEKNGAKIVIGVRESVRLNPVITPADAADQRVTYKSSNNKVASVTQGGVIRAKKKGNAVITVTTANQKTCRIKVTVRQAPKKVTIGAKNRTLKKGKTLRLRVKLPSGSAAFGIRYNSSRKKIATVDAKGNVKAIRKGSTVITVKLYNGKKARLKLTVK
ncbi:MAG: Ig-like domain-containing protein [Lachnospiraceae bacterium]